MGYDPQQRAEALALLGDPQNTMADVARATGIPRGTLRRWKLAGGAGNDATLKNDPSAQGSFQESQSESSRNENGTFKTGYSGNPGGSSSAGEAARRLASEAALVIIKSQLRRLAVFPEVMAPSQSQAELRRQQLERSILDRGLGKAIQFKEVAVSASLNAGHVQADPDLDELSDDDLVALEAARSIMDRAGGQ